jgi:hypothetical protein
MPALFAFCVWLSAESGHHRKAASSGEVFPLGVSVSLGITGEAVERVRVIMEAMTDDWSRQVVTSPDSDFTLSIDDNLEQRSAILRQGSSRLTASRNFL